MHYLIDAYNLFFWLQTHPSHKEKRTSPQVNGKGVQGEERFIAKRRERFIQQMAPLLSQLSSQVTLVFDAGLTHAHAYPSLTIKEGIEILFSPKGQTADECIIEFVYLSKHPSQITVITSDRLLSKKVNEYGAQTMDTQHFFKRLKRRNKQEEETKMNDDTPWEKERLEKLFKKRLYEPPDDETT